jgi:hypothetical protein
MANILVTSYYSRWDLHKHTGRIALYDSDNRLIENHTYTDPAEFQVVIGMLSNEKHVWYETEARYLRTGNEPAGD